jgi:tetratricopeptide (TPR) repeat protein
MEKNPKKNDVTKMSQQIIDSLPDKATLTLEEKEALNNLAKNLRNYFPDEEPKIADMIQQVLDLLQTLTALGQEEKKSIKKIAESLEDYSSEEENEIRYLSQRIIDRLAANDTLKSEEGRALNNLKEILKFYLPEEEVEEESPGKEKPEEIEPKIGLRRKIFNSVIASNKLILASGVIAITVVFLVFGIYEFTRYYLYIENFHVSESIEKQGYSGRVIINKLRDTIILIEHNAKTLKENRLYIHTGSEKMPQVEISGSEISLSWLVKYFKKLLNYKICRVVGEITFHEMKSNEIELTLRIIGEPAKSVNGSLKNLDDLLQDAAEYIYSRTEPYILAKYYYESEETFKKELCLSTINLILKNKEPYDDVWAYNLWGIVLHQQNNYKSAIAKYRNAIEIDPYFAHAYYNWALVLYDQKKYEEAIAMFEKGIKVNSSIALAYFNYGLALYDWGKYEEAIAIYAKAVEKDPNDFNSYNNSGLALYKLEKYEDAIKFYEKAIQINPNFTYSYYNCGVALHALKRNEEAIAMFEKAIKVDPNFAYGYHSCGLVLYDQKKYG